MTRIINYLKAMKANFEWDNLRLQGEQRALVPIMSKEAGYIHNECERQMKENCAWIEEIEKVIEIPLTSIMDELPENKPLYKDSGLWQLRSDDMVEPLVEQNTWESNLDFINNVLRYKKLTEIVP